MNLKSRSVIAVLAAATVVALSGCSTASPSEDSSASATTTADASLAALVPASYASSGVIKAGTFSGGAPASFVGADGTTPEGASVELLDAAAAKLGLTVDWSLIQFDSMITGLQAGSTDVVISMVNDTKDREGTVDFVDFAQQGYVPVVADGNPANVDGADLCGSRLGIATGSTFLSTAQALSDTCVAAGKAAINITTFTDGNAALLAIQNGTIDVTFSEYRPASVYEAGGTFEAFEALDPFTPNTNPVGMAVSKSSELAPALQAAVQSMVDDGSYQAIFDKWDISTLTISKDLVVVNGAKA